MFSIAFGCWMLAVPALAESGLPVPRFVALKSDEVNVRTGPGVRYPVRWVYRMDAMPMEVVEEFEQWRKLRDVDGETGWVHQSMIQGHRSVLIAEDEAILRRDPADAANPVLRAARYVRGDVVECQLEWCRIQINNSKGWIRKTSLWGVYAEELIED